MTSRASPLSPAGGGRWLLLRLSLLMLLAAPARTDEEQPLLPPGVELRVQRIRDGAGS